MLVINRIQDDGNYYPIEGVYEIELVNGIINIISYILNNIKNFIFKN
jgi:hypothetical protein